MSSSLSSSASLLSAHEPGRTCPPARDPHRLTSRPGQISSSAPALRTLWPDTSPNRSPLSRRPMFRMSPVLPRRPRVDAGGLKPNTWQRFERLGSAWEQAKLGLGDEPQDAAEDEPEVVANPRRRARTPLTESQVDAIRTARADGESVVSISRRFGVHRMTVWTHTKDLLS